MTTATAVPTDPTTEQPTLEVLSVDWLSARQAEANANARRVAVESQIIALAGARDEGAQTHTAGAFKITITSKLTRSIAWEEYDQLESRIPEALRPIKWRRELDETGCKYLQSHEPAVYAILAKAITVKPAKTAVSVKVV